MRGCFVHKLFIWDLASWPLYKVAFIQGWPFHCIIICCCMLETTPSNESTTGEDTEAILLDLVTLWEMTVAKKDTKSSKSIKLMAAV